MSSYIHNGSLCIPANIVTDFQSLVKLTKYTYFHSEGDDNLIWCPLEDACLPLKGDYNYVVGIPQNILGECSCGKVLFLLRPLYFFGGSVVPTFQLISCFP